MAEPTLEKAARDVLAAYDQISIGMGGWSVHREAFNRLRNVLTQAEGRDAGLAAPRTVEARPLWELAGPACNAADDARDLSMVMQRALGTYDNGFGRDELYALWTMSGEIQARATEAANAAKAVMDMIGDAY